MSDMAAYVPLSFNNRAYTQNIVYSELLRNENRGVESDFSDDDNVSLIYDT